MNQEDKDKAKLIREISGSPLSNPTRLAIALYLLPRKEAYFTRIAEDLGITRGNLRYHLDAMIREGLIDEKYVFSNRPRKQVSLTQRGARELDRIIRLLEKLVGGI